MKKKKKSKETIHYDKLMKAKVKIINQFYPKPPATIEEDSFGIVTAKIVEWDTTSAEPILHPTYQTITIKGNRLPKIVMNEEYLVHGYETHSEYGVSYTVAMMSELVDLSTPEKQRAFLSELMTPKQLESLFNTFENPYEVIQTGDIDQLTQVNGIGRKTAEKLLRKIMGAHDLALIYSELADYQLTQREVEHLVYHFKNPKLVVEAMKENPYILMRVVSRVGFNRCDEMAMRAGVKADSPYRVAGFIQHHLEQQADMGNSWITTQSLFQAIDEAFVKTPISNQALSKGLKMMTQHLMWHNEDKSKVALKQVLALEEAIALELTRLLTAKNTFEFTDWESKLNEQEVQQGWSYTDEQRQGIQMLLENNVSVLQGYAGSGKTSCVAGMLAVFDGKYKTSACALSGKAAVNISESASVNGTQIEGKTIHRLLKVRGEEGEFAYNKYHPLPDQIIILDEVSMVGGELFLSLLQAIPTGSKLIMLGDLGQLESIGRCNIMFDMVESGVIPNIFLTKIHRQASRSAIVTDSITVRQGNHLCKASDEKVEVRGELQDLTLDVYQDKSKTLTKVIDHFKKEWAEMDNIMDIIVLMPMRDRGEACVYKANNEIQKIIHPNTMFKPYYTVNEGTKNEFKIYVGDKVLNNKNDYSTLNKYGEETPIFNGNLGVVTEINGANQTLTVDFDLIGEVVLNQDQIKYLTLGYAMTVHKCIHPDTQLFTSIGIKSLRDFDPGTPVHESKMIGPNADVFNGSFMETPSSYYNAGKSKCQHIITEAGYDLIATLDHKLDVLDRDGYIWTKPVSQIKEGDILLIQRNNKHFGRRRQEARIKFHGEGEPTFQVPMYLHETQVLAFTLILNYGFIGEHEITLTLHQKELVNVVKRGIKLGFNVDIVVNQQVEDDEGYYEVVIPSMKLCTYIRQLYRKETFDYFFPQVMMLFNENITKKMLQLLFEEVVYDATNQAIILQCRTEKMADQVRMMLLNFGIISNKKEVDGEFDLHLHHHHLLSFKDLIGCYCEESQKKLETFCLQVEDHSDQEAGYGLYHLVNELIAKHQLGIHPLEQATMSELKQFVEGYNEILVGDLRFEYLKDIVLNCYLDPIKTMTSVATYTHCIEMPQTHRFIQNGIRGWNCVTGETHLFTNQGIKQLKELDNGAKPYEAKPYEGEIKVFNGEGMEKPSHFYNAGESETRIIKTKTGYEIEGTLDHRAYVLAEDGNLQVKTFGELTTDDYLFISSGMEIYGDEVELPKEWFNIKTKSTGLSYQLPQKMTKELALFLGLVVADGSLSTKSIQLTKRHLEVVTQFKALTEQLFGYTTGVIKENKKEETGEVTHYSYTIHSSFITAFVKQFDGVSPHNKFVPTCILKAPKEYQVEFLKGVFEDGSVNIKNNRFEHIELTMKSKKMSEQIQMMLLNMGILVSKGWYGGTFRLTIYSNHAMTFKRLIGFISPNKQERLNTYLIEEQIKNSKLTIPYIYQLVDNLYQSHHLTNQRNLDPTIKKKIAKMRMRKTVTQQTLKEILEAIEPFIENDKGVMTYLKWVSTMRIEPIKSITQSRNQTYCLEMPITHRFVQNGLLLLNCQGMGVKKVIIGIDYGSYALLTKEMIYTAITRAKQKCILVAETKALRFAIGRSNLKKKQTFLQQLLKGLNQK